ncbi:MAG: PAS domain S-box protein [Geminicoccaceae bacterium]
MTSPNSPAEDPPRLVTPDSGGELAARWSRLLVLGLAPAVLLIGALAVWQLLSLRSDYLEALGQTALEQSETVDGAVADAAEHLAQLRLVAEARLAGDLSGSTSPLLPYVRPESDDPVRETVAGLYLDAVAEQPWRDRAANLVARSELLQRPGGREELEAALALAEPMWLAHSIMPALRWSYYFSAGRDLVLMYPWVPSSELVRHQGFSELGAWFDSWFQFEILTGALPENNPQRTSYWTSAYEDGNGAGWMISHCAPVYVGDRFAGMVGTDILLSYFDDLLRGGGFGAGRAWLVSNAGQVISVADRPFAAGSKPPVIAEALPADLRGMPTAELLDPAERFHRIGSQWVMAQPLRHAPWTLLWTVPASEVRATVLWRFLPSALLVAGVLAAGAGALWLLQRTLVQPAMRLADHVRAQGAAAVDLPVPAQMPPPWSELAAEISAAFRARREVALVNARFLAAGESLVDGLAIWDADDRLVYHNSRYPMHLTENLRNVLKLGVRFEDWIEAGLAQGPIYHPDMGPDFKERRLRMREQAISDHEHQLIDERWVRLRESRMAGGGRVLLTSDITERKRRERDLAVLATAIEQVGDSVEIATSDYRLIYVNPAFTRLTGYTSEEAIGHTAAEILRSRHHDAAFWADMDATIRRGETWTGGLISRHKDGHDLVQEATISPLRGADGSLTHFVAVKRDVAERRRAEQALRQSEERYRGVVEAQTEFIIRQRPDGTLSFANEAYGRHLGMTQAQLLDPAWNDLTALPEEEQRASKAAWAAMTPENPVNEIELHPRMPDGRRCIERWSERGIFDAAGKLVEIQAVGRDVTAEKAAKAALRASERLRDAVLAAALDCVVGMDAEGRIVEFNPAAERTFGHSRADAMGKLLDELLIPQRMQGSHRDGLRRHLETGRSRILGKRLELPARHADGREIPVEVVVVSTPTPDGDRYLAYMRDISDRKRAEAAIRESEERYRSVVESQSEFIVRMTPRGRLLFVNDAYCRHMRMSREQLLDPAWDDSSVLEPEDRERYWRSIAELTPGQPANSLECQPTLPDGRRPIEQWNHRGFFDADGRLVEVQAVGRDITEQRMAEQALLASEERFRTIVEDQIELIARFDPAYRFTFVNRAFAEHVGRPAESVLGTSVLEMLTPEQQRMFRSQLAELTPDSPTVAYETEVVGEDGRIRHEAWTDRALFDAQGRLVEYQSVGRDVTAEREAAEILRASEERYRAVVQDQTEIIGRFDANFRLVFANEAHCRMRGRSFEEMVGEDYFDSVPDPLRGDLRQRLLALTPDHPVDVGENEKIMPDGTWRWYAWTNRALFDRAGRLAGYQSVGRDITEQKLAERALRESESAMRAIAEGVPVPLAIALLDRPEILFVNARAMETFGLGLGEQKEQIERVWVDLDDRVRLLREVAAGRDVDGAETRMRHADGRELWVLFSARRITYRGQPAFLAVMTDITERRATEEALRASETRLAAFLENAPVGMYLKDADGRYVMANTEMAKVFGRPVAEMLGRAAGDVLLPAEAELVRAYDREILERGVPSVHEEYLEGLDAYAWTMVIRFPVRDASGRITHIGGFDVDISAQKRAEQSLRASEARLAAFMQHAPVGVYLKDLRGRYVLANPEMSHVFGKPAEAMIGRTAADTAFNHDLELIAEAEQELMRTGRPVVREEYTPGVEAYRWSIVIRFALRDPAGTITHIGGFHVDNTAQKRAEDALRESEQRFRRFAEAHPVPLLVLRQADTRVLFVNPAYLDLFQVSWDELDTLDKTTLWADPADRTVYMAELQRAGEIRGREALVRRRDGEVIPASLSSRLIEYGGEPALVTSVIDLSRQKAAESEIERQREALHQSEKLAALGSLLAGVAHELNNPLSVVVGYSSMLEEFAPDDASRRRAERVHAAADRCARIVKAFLAMARQKPPAFGPVALNHVVDAALELSAYGLRTADVEVVRALDPELPAVWGDADQLHQVITNLVVNAQHALQEIAGPRRLTVRTERRNGDVLVEVADNGPGMDAELRKRIFEPFFTTKPQGMGVGVGLSLCHGIVASHGGRIEVASERGAGSRFRVVLPLSTAPAAATDPANGGPKGGRGRILVADDETEIADLVREVLSREGYEVTVVRSGREALAALGRGSFDVVISDLRMPDLDGPGLWRELKASRPEVAERMVFITGDTLGADASRFLREATVPVLDKPLDLAQLRRQVAEMVAHGRGH